MKPTVQINGGSDEQTAFIREHIETLLKRLNLHRLGLFLEIELRQGFGKYEYGYCENVDVERWAPRDFVIELNETKKNSTLLRVLAHELTHVKQYARREMVEQRDGSVIWKGRKCHRTKYHDLPWEKEALKSETILLEGIVWNK